MIRSHIADSREGSHFKVSSVWCDKASSSPPIIAGCRTHINSTTMNLNAQM